MRIDQYIKSESIKRRLFSWAWSETKRNAYDKLLEDFLSKPEVEELDSRKKVLFYWYLYCGTLQDYVLNGKDNGIVGKCPLSEEELQKLFKE